MAFRDVMTGGVYPPAQAATVSAFASLSMNPPMVLVSLDREPDLLKLVRDSGHFGVNVLGRDQSQLATRFARKGKTKFDGIAWHVANGVPRIEGVSGWGRVRDGPVDPRWRPGDRSRRDHRGGERAGSAVDLSRTGLRGPHRLGGVVLGTGLPPSEAVQHAVAAT